MLNNCNKAVVIKKQVMSNLVKNTKAQLIAMLNELTVENTTLKSKAPKTGGGFSKFGHQLKAQSGKIDTCLLKGAPVTIADIVVECGARNEARVKDHLSVLQFNKGVNLKFTEGGKTVVLVPETDS